MKVLNLYAGIGGNRKLWTDVEVTAVEYNEEIAGIYKDYFPDDIMIIADAHEYLLKHYKEFDFIWASPPCPTHSRARYWSSKGGGCDVKYPDATLWQEILFLKHYASCKWVIENVKPFYENDLDGWMMPNAELNRHLFWNNFNIKKYSFNEAFYKDSIDKMQELYGYDLKGYGINNITQILRNCINPDLGLYILEQARGIIRENNITQQKLFA